MILVWPSHILHRLESQTSLGCPTPPLLSMASQALASLCSSIQVSHSAFFTPMMGGHGGRVPGAGGSTAGTECVTSGSYLDLSEPLFICNPQKVGAQEMVVFLLCPLSQCVVTTLRGKIARLLLGITYVPFWMLSYLLVRLPPDPCQELDSQETQMYGALVTQCH